MNLLIDHEVLRAEIELEGASAENVVERARVYLALLLAFRKQLCDFARMSRGRYSNRPAEQTTDPFSTAIHVAESEILRVERLLDKFSTISAWEAAQIFNRLGYRGSSDWEAAANEVRTTIGTERMPAESAIEEAGMLLRGEYAASRVAAGAKGH